MAANSPDRHETLFHQMIHVLAEHCNFQLNEVTVALYDDALAPFGYQRVVEAMKEIFNTRRGGDRFPSISEIREKMGVEVSPRALAVECSNRLFWVFNHWRDRFTELEDFEQKFRAMVGDLEWETVSRMGGYRAMYKEWSECSNLEVLRAQVRESALAILEIQKFDALQIQGSARQQIKGVKNG